MPAIDINRATTGVILPPEIAKEIWQPTIEQSAFMTLANSMPVPGAGEEFQKITGDPVAQWVGETEPAPVSRHTFGNKTVKTYTLSIIEPFSKKFLRDKSALYEACIERLPLGFGKKFDQTVMSTSAPGNNFDVLGGCGKVSIVPTAPTTVYDQFIAADAAIGASNGIMNGIALAPQGRSIVLGAVDGVGRPLFTPGVGSGTVGNILGASVAVKKGVYVAGTAASGSGSSAVEATPAIVGVAGDFDDAWYGYTGGIEMTVDTSATLVDGDEEIHLFQQGMIAVRFDWDLTFIVRDTAEFILLTGATPTA